MTPIAMGGIGLAAYGIYELFFKKPSFQTHTTSGPNGQILHVRTPVTSNITPAQATGIPNKQVLPGTPPAVAVNVPGQGIVHAPPNSVTVTTIGVQPPPFIITPTGASTATIATTKDVQRALNALGYTPRLTEDGIIGPNTIANIKQFQSSSGIAVTGSADAATKSALAAALSGLSSSQNAATIAQATFTGPPDISHIVVKDVQHMLNVLGTSPPLVEDGKIGPKTVAAIKSFQTTHGLPVDGIAGDPLKTALAIAFQTTTGSPSPSSGAVASQAPAWGSGIPT